MASVVLGSIFLVRDSDLLACCHGSRRASMARGAAAAGWNLGFVRGGNGDAEEHGAALGQMS
ncbi:unnamed protein product [Clonostachys solani]|uniref:Uncharacterized protein n=1 Tax=Clonostachys solani TaxID=160281 RepID=A0A9N9VYI3_9HYPO|nr:unnamed protein product [Clonostachys solani]